MAANRDADSVETILVINAGGVSRRMGGRAKALLPVPPGGEPLIQRILARLAPLTPRAVLVITHDDEVAAAVQAAPANGRPHPHVLGDRTGGLGPLGGLWTALEWAHAYGPPAWLYFVACDMPCLNPATLRVLLAHADSRYDVVIPITGGRFEPLHALYHSDCLSAVRAAIDARRLKLTSFLADVRVKAVEEAELRRVDPELRSLTNVNTPDDWHRIQAQLWNARKQASSGHSRTGDQ